MMCSEKPLGAASNTELSTSEKQLLERIMALYSLDRMCLNSDFSDQKDFNEIKRKLNIGG